MFIIILRSLRNKDKDERGTTSVIGYPWARHHGDATKMLLSNRTLRFAFHGNIAPIWSSMLKIIDFKGTVNTEPLQKGMSLFWFDLSCWVCQELYT